MEQPIDTSTAAGKYFLDVLGVWHAPSNFLRLPRVLREVRQFTQTLVVYSLLASRPHTPNVLIGKFEMVLRR